MPSKGMHQKKNVRPCDLTFTLITTSALPGKANMNISVFDAHRENGYGTLLGI